MHRIGYNKTYKKGIKMTLSITTDNPYIQGFNDGKKIAEEFAESDAYIAKVELDNQKYETSKFKGLAIIFGITTLIGLAGLFYSAYEKDSYKVHSRVVQTLSDNGICHKTGAGYTCSLPDNIVYIGD